MRSSVLRRRGAVLFVPWLLTACHSYASTSVETVPTNEPVRVELTDRASVEFSTALGARTRQLHGRVVERVDSVLVLRVSAVKRDGADEESWSGEAVRLPLAAVARVEREELSRGRTGLFVGGIVAALGIALALLGGNGDDTVAGRPGGGRPGGER